MTKKDMEYYAKLSDVAYQPYLITKRKWLRDLDPSLSIDQDLTNKYITTVTDGKNVYVSHRGTKLKDFKDLTADAAIFTGTEKMSKRFKEADEHLEKVKDKYGDKNIVLTGHSLGGSVSRALAKEHDLDAHVFNTGSSVSAVRDSLHSAVQKEERKHKITHYTTGNDVISVLGNLPSVHDRVVLVEAKGSNTHSLQNFTA